MVSLLKNETAITGIVSTHTKNELERYLEEMELPSCTPEHLFTEEQTPVAFGLQHPVADLTATASTSLLTIAAARENAPLVALAAQMPQMPQVTVQKDTSLAKSQAGVLTQINQKEKAQEKLDAFLRQSEVFALRQDLRFKYDKKDVLIEQGARIMSNCALRRVQ